MNDALRALAISAGILSPVVVLIIIVSIAAVRRGEAGPLVLEPVPSGVPVTQGAAAAAAKPAKAAVPEVEEVSVLEILLYGTGLFVLAVLALFVLSLISHM
jgi:hypothetical protein